MNQAIEQIKLNVEGMTCSNCALTVTKFLEKQNLQNIYVDFGSGEVNFKLTDKEQNLNKIKKGISNLGYTVIDSQNSKKNTFKFDLNKKFYLSAIFTLPLFVHMILNIHLLHNPIFQLICCVPVIIIGLLHFGKSAWHSVKSGIPNMDVLITLGSMSAFVYSLIGTLKNLGPDFLFYETSATIITLVLLGNLIEHKTVKQTSGAIEELSRLQIKTAKKIINENGIEKYIEVGYDEIKKKDVLLVNTGDKIPVDGAIVWGNGSIDESMITGESMPVDKYITDKVIGGTILKFGNIKLIATKVGNETALAQIIELIKNAQASKPPIQKIGDKVSAVFVPIVVLISISTFFVSIYGLSLTFQEALMRTVAVLVIACPCAMGLATPTAVAAGLGKAARQGILIKGGNTLEQMASIKNIVFDKTGTLTTGEFKISKINLLSEVSQEEVLRIVYNLELFSSHPIAKSLVSELSKGGFIPLYFSKTEELKGIGIRTTDKEGNLYQIGSNRIISGLVSDNSHDLYLIKNEKLIATIDIEDSLRENTGEVIQYLAKNNYRNILLSGDRIKKCEAISKKAGIKEIHSEKLPDEKLRIISNLVIQAPTAMIGDGINDAPALAKATVGISLSSATEIAIQSAQVILLKEKLSKLPIALSISKLTLKTIKQNLFWAFFYNIVAIPIAAAGYLNPMVAALTMAFSDVIVIGNSIRLKFRKIE